MTAAFFAILAIAVVAVALLVGRERSRRGALEQAHRQVLVATDLAEEAARLRGDAETSLQQQIAATAAVTAETEATLGARVASVEARLAELHATSSGRIEVLERNLRDTEAERCQLADAAAAHAAQTEATSAQIAGLEAASTTSTAALDAAADRVAALEVELTELRSETGPLVPDNDREPAPADLRAERDGDDGWHLLLARVERQWAEVVNAKAEERGVVHAPRGEQLAQAVQRDLERLREEVGVEATMAPSEPLNDENPLTTFLAVGEAVALLAYHSEHVLVDLRDQAVVSGQGWTGGDGARHRLEQLVETASAAGLDATVEVLDHAAQVVLGVRGRRTPSA